MGYYTNYILKTKQVNKSGKLVDWFFDDFEAWIKTDPCTMKYSWKEILNSRDEFKWYDHNQDMLELSLKFPDIIFDLYGDGEEYGDTWHKYYKNGKVQICTVQMKFDDFDQTKLV